MKKSKFTEVQIAYALRQTEAGTRVEDICRQMGVSQATFFAWKKKYGGLGVTELRKLRPPPLALIYNQNDKLPHLTSSSGELWPPLG